MQATTPWTSRTSAVGSQVPWKHLKSVTNDFVQAVSVICRSKRGHLGCIVVRSVFVSELARAGVERGTLEKPHFNIRFWMAPKSQLFCNGMKLAEIGYWCAVKSGPNRTESLGMITFLLIARLVIQYRFFSTEDIVQTYFDKLILQRHTIMKSEKRS